MSERLWWSRAGLVLFRPVAVFEELRDDSDGQSQARQEPVVAIVVLAGVAGVLAGLDGHAVDLDAVDLAVWTFLGGALEGFALYFLLGALVYVGGAAAGSAWRYRHARHLLAFAVVPLAASLPVWAVRLALDADFDPVLVAVLAWCSGLLVVGLRTLHAWPWGRTLAAAALPLLVPVLVLARTYGVV